MSWSMLKSKQCPANNYQAMTSYNNYQEVIELVDMHYFYLTFFFILTMPKCKTYHLKNSFIVTLSNIICFSVYTGIVLIGICNRDEVMRKIAGY